MDGAAAHAHRVDDGDAAGGDIVAVADAAGGAPADLLAQIGAAAADQLEQFLGLGIDRLGRTAEAAVDVNFHVMLGRDAGHGLAERRLASALLLGVHGAHVYTKPRLIRHHLGPYRKTV